MEYVLSYNFANPFVSVDYSPHRQILSQCTQNSAQLYHFACM